MSAIVLAVCGDPGGANAVAPVIELLRADKRVTVRALAYAEAHVLWAERGLKHDVLGEDTQPADIANYLTEETKFLLTGTSANQYDFEKHFIAAARTEGVRSLSVLDFWSNYALRFSDLAGDLRYLPDRIAVMDELASFEMQADGIDAERIVVTGHPAWDGLEAVRAEFGPAQRRALRQQYRMGDHDWLILYASQPIPPADSNHAWFDREAALEVLICALERIAQDHDKTVLLLVRYHPKESRQPFRHRGSTLIRIESQSGGDGRPWLLAADTVVGMATMLLVESALLGRPTLSLRLGLDGTDPFPANRSGLVSAVYSHEEVSTALEAALVSPAPIVPIPAHAAKASRNVADLVYCALHFEDA
jgi:hypothetical protein